MRTSSIGSPAFAGRLQAVSAPWHVANSTGDDEVFAVGALLAGDEMASDQVGKELIDPLARGRQPFGHVLGPAASAA